MFSFGNIILCILTHEWPEPSPSKKYEGGQIVVLSELQCRERYVVLFTAQEKQLFLPTVGQCLENRPDKRPSSTVLLRELRRIESSLPSSGHVAAPFKQLHQQLSAKEEECRKNYEAFREKDRALREKDKALAEKEQALQNALREKDHAIRTQQGTNQALSKKDEELRMRAKLLKETEEACRQKDEVIAKQCVALLRLNQSTDQHQQVSVFVYIIMCV